MFRNPTKQEIMHNLCNETIDLSEDIIDDYIEKNMKKELELTNVETAV